MNWEQKAKIKRAQIDLKIPKEWILDSIPTPEEQPSALEYLDSILPAKEVKITNSTARELISKMSKGEITSYEVTYAFCHRAALAHQLCNCLSEIMFDEALKRAKELDESFKINKKPTGNLHGFPVSLKDQFNIEGIDSTMGFVANIDKPKSKNDVSLLVSDLLDEGAIIYVKTTVPTSMMSSDTFSHIYGYTLNSINRKVSCGGSSGGEGLLVGARGSLIGFGTDLGGSIRIPSAFQGLYGLRPSSNRISYNNVSNTIALNPTVCSVAGPICADLEDLEMITKVVLNKKQWLVDSKVPPIGWRDIKLPETLKVGFIDTITGVVGHPSIQRGLAMLKKAIRDNGHEVVEFSDEDLPVSYVKVFELLRECFSVSGYQDIKDLFEEANEPIAHIVDFIKEFKPQGLAQEWELLDMKDKIQTAYNVFLNETGLDCLVCPTWMITSFQPGKTHYMASFTRFFNVLDFSCITLPVLKVNSKDTYPEDFEPKDECSKFIYDNFDIKIFKDTPITLQIATRKYEEEKAIELCKLFKSYL